MSQDMWSRWAVPPPLQGATRAQRARHAAAEAASRAEIRWIWNELCSGLDLTRRIVPTGTLTREPPEMGRVFLGPPTHFTVQLRPGQLPADVERVGARIAAAYDVSAVAVHHLPQRWIDVELIERPRVPPTAPIDAPELDAPVPTIPHLPPRRRRGPFGRPRSWRMRRPKPRQV